MAKTGVNTDWPQQHNCRYKQYSIEKNLDINIFIIMPLYISVRLSIKLHNIQLNYLTVASINNKP